MHAVTSTFPKNSISIYVVSLLGNAANILDSSWLWQNTFYVTTSAAFFHFNSSIPFMCVLISHTFKVKHLSDWCGKTQDEGSRLLMMERQMAAGKTALHMSN
jgi:hypothetical protein